MFNIVNRFSGVANTAMTCSMVLAALVVVTSSLQLWLGGAWGLQTAALSNVRATAAIKKSFAFGAIDRKPKENSKIVFDLDADLTPLFNWNTKQVFVYLTAEYPGKSPDSANKVTYWDKIITSKDDAVLHLRSQTAKYSVWDVEKSFRQREANLTLEWNVQPHVGLMWKGKTAPGTTFTFAEFEPKT